MSNVVFKEISAYEAIKEIYGHKNAWSFLLDFVEASEEIDFDDAGNIVFVYCDGKSTKNNYFTNEDLYCWVAGFEGDNIVFLQLIRRWSKFHFELVIAQKKKNSEASNLFGQLVEYVKDTYVKAKYFSTFPMNDRLREYYKLSGFYDWKQKELRLDLR